MTADDPWGGAVEGAPQRVLATMGAAPDQAALERWPGLAAEAQRAIEELAAGALGACAAAERVGEGQAALDLIAWVQATRRALAALESDVTRWAGLSGAVERKGTMPDGRTYTVRRGQNRKAWQHDAWKHDARAAVLRQHGLEGADLVNAATGELVDLQGVVTHVQEVHGATAPRVGVLKALGLDPDNYAETSPGAWGVEFTDPSSPEQ